MELFEKTAEKNYIYNGKIINVRRDMAELPNGKLSVREVVEHNGGVCVAAITEKNELIFVRQFRYPYMEVILELPAGKLEKGEDPFEAGKRELEEETGRVAAKYHDMGKFYPTPGYCGEIIHLYAAEELTETQMHPDDDEYLEVERIPLEKAVDMVVSGEIRDGKTIALILKVAEMQRRGIIGGGK
ncbi:MAG: NUDIX hydrolase [Clostridia bacterium]|nr:NUDIX hydrolase [Clostridia bacterium]